MARTRLRLLAAFSVVVTVVASADATPSESADATLSERMARLEAASEQKLKKSDRKLDRIEKLVEKQVRIDLSS